MAAPSSPLLNESNLQHHYLSVGNDVTFHFVEYCLPASQHAPLVVLVHGWPEFWFAWRHQMAPIAAAGFRPVAVDLRGYGQSTVAGKNKFSVESYRIKHVCDDLAQMLDFFKSPSAIFIGHDWGGAVVWRMARYKPERVAAVASICTPFRPRKGKYMSNEEMAVKFPMFTYQVYFSKQDGAIAAKELEEDVARSMKVLLRSTKPKDKIGKFMGPHQPDSFLAGFPKEVPRSDIYSESEMNAYIDAYSKSGFRTNLMWYSTGYLNWKDEENVPQTVNQNALMVTAGKDAILIPALTQDMDKWVPRLKRAHVEDAGHWVTAEQREQLTTILIEWLKGLDSPIALHSKL